MNQKNAVSKLIEARAANSAKPKPENDVAQELETVSSEPPQPNVGTDRERRQQAIREAHAKVWEQRRMRER
jgi:hypothetical protein